jgi:hypothetical protein
VAAQLESWKQGAARAGESGCRVTAACHTGSMCPHAIVLRLPRIRMGGPCQPAGPPLPPPAPMAAMSLFGAAAGGGGPGIFGRAGPMPLPRGAPQSRHRAATPASAPTRDDYHENEEDDGVGLHGALASMFVLNMPSCVPDSCALPKAQQHHFVQVHALSV